MHSSLKLILITTLASLALTSCGGMDSIEPPGGKENLKSESIMDDIAPLKPGETGSDDGEAIADQNFKEVDVFGVTCTEIPRARKEVEAAYAYNHGLVEKEYELYKAQYGIQLEECINASREPKEFQDCDKVWEEVQKAHQEAVRDVSNTKAYDNYQKKKKEWDKCYDKAKGKHLINAFQPQEWECYEQYANAMRRLTTEIQKLKDDLQKTRDRNQRILDQKSLACMNKVGDISTGGEIESGGDEDGLNTITCPEIPAARIRWTERYQARVSEENAFFEEQMEILNEALLNCTNLSKSKIEENKCKDRYHELAGPRTRFHNEYLKAMERGFNLDMKSLDEKEKACLEKLSLDLHILPKKISVIPYQGKLLPVSGLHTFTGKTPDECDAVEHWHANNGSVKATNGQTVSDPGGCGFGKTRDVRVEEIEE